MKRGDLLAVLALATAMLLAVGPTSALAQDNADKKGEEKKEAAKKETSPSDKKDDSGKAHTVRRGPIKIDVTLSGVVEATSMTRVTFAPKQWSDLQVKKAVPQGASVKQGQPLIWLETAKLDEQIAQLEQAEQLSKLAIKQAEIELEALEKTAPLHLAAVKRSNQIQQEDLKQYLEIERPFSIRSVHKSFESDQNYLEYAQEELNQLEKMYAEDDLTEETEEIILKRARRSVESAKFYLESGEISRDRSLKFSIPRRDASYKEQAAQAEIAMLATQQSIPVQLNQARLTLEKQKIERQQAQKKLAELRADREGMVIKAPAEGLVYYGACVRGKWTTAASVALKLQPGKRITSNEVVMTIVAPQPLFLRADVPEKELHWLKKGADGKVTSPARPNADLSGVISAISNVPVSDGKFDAVVDLGGKGVSQLVAGMSGKFTLRPYAKKDAILAPKKAVFTDDWDDSKRYVYVVKDGKHEKRNVTVGQTSGDQTEILKGLAESEDILLAKP